jgi:hypothetical protein
MAYAIAVQGSFSLKNDDQKRLAWAELSKLELSVVGTE